MKTVLEILKGAAHKYRWKLGKSEVVRFLGENDYDAYYSPDSLVEYEDIMMDAESFIKNLVCNYIKADKPCTNIEYYKAIAAEMDYEEDYEGEIAYYLETIRLNPEEKTDLFNRNFIIAFKCFIRQQKVYSKYRENDCFELTPKDDRYLAKNRYKESANLRKGGIDV